MIYFADYKVVDGMTFVRIKTQKGTVVSYGRNSSQALGNVANKYGSRYKERVIVRLGNLTTDPIEHDVTVKRTSQSEWWYKRRERNMLADTSQPSNSEPADKDTEYVYDVDGGVLKVYKVTLEKMYKIKQPQQGFAIKQVMGGEQIQPRLPAEPGMVMFNTDGGDKDVA